MSDKQNDYGILLNSNIKLHRLYFKEMSKLLGINCWYRAPKKGKKFNLHGDLDSKYEPPIQVSVIFDDHPDQQTMKKMGWVAELQDGSSMIHVPYDLPGLEVGALFTIPSGLDDAVGRTFRVISMKTIMIYPASITCEVALEYEDTTPISENYDFTKTNFTKLVDNEEDD